MQSRNAIIFCSDCTPRLLLYPPCPPPAVFCLATVACGLLPRHCTLPAHRLRSFASPLSPPAPSFVPLAPPFASFERTPSGQSIVMTKLLTFVLAAALGLTSAEGAGLETCVLPMELRALGAFALCVDRPAQPLRPLVPSAPLLPRSPGHGSAGTTKVSR